jgi:hypothetical protein
LSKTIGIIGTRKRDSKQDFRLVYSEFEKVYEEGDTICSGLCPKGGDRFAVILSEMYDTKVLWFPVQWGKYGKSAGFRRNTDIAENSDILIACVSPDRKGGTEDTVRKFINMKSSDNLIIV